MRVAIISDVHGNCLALEAVLADLDRRPVDRLVCLGDAILGGAQPAETALRLRALDCPVVLGNADAWLVSGDASVMAFTVSPMQEAIREWTAARLSPADRAFLAAFPPTLEIDLDAHQSLLCFHGSPRSFNDLLLPTTPEDEFWRMLGDCQHSLLAGGHTHQQQIRCRRGALFFNPGSVGMSRDDTWPDTGFRLYPWAEYAILSAEGSGWELLFRRVPLEVARLCATIRASGRPDAEVLAGWYEHGTEDRALPDSGLEDE